MEPSGVKARIGQCTQYYGWECLWNVVECTHLEHFQEQQSPKYSPYAIPIPTMPIKMFEHQTRIKTPASICPGCQFPLAAKHAEKLYYIYIYSSCHRSHILNPSIPGPSCLGVLARLPYTPFVGDLHPSRASLGAEHRAEQLLIVPGLFHLLPQR